MSGPTIFPNVVIALFFYMIATQKKSVLILDMGHKPSEEFVTDDLWMPDDPCKFLPPSKPILVLTTRTKTLRLLLFTLERGGQNLKRLDREAANQVSA
jgi:hypothetical protein